jgi:1,5-anhydro-D-fructose reductase (1,5-anhydro-D-mannitol-forming)
MIRFGIVGFGLHGVRRLMPGFAKAARCTVTAISRRDLAKARASAAEYNLPHFFDSTEALCACPDVDAVLVASPDALHLRDTLTAIKHGKPVLCEKPMAMNPAECRRMVEAARAAKVLLGVAHVFRFEESTNRLRERILAGAIGRPLFARAEFCYPGRTHGRSWIADPALACGGPIADVGVHCIDGLRYMLQDEVIEVSAIAVRDEYSGGVEAGGTLLLRFARGTLATVLVSARAAYRTPVEFIGESAVLRAADCFNVERPITLDLQREGHIVESEQVSNHLAYARQVDAFAAAIEGKALFQAPAEDGWQNQEVLAAAYRSVQSGHVEAVPRVARQAAET